MGTDGPNWDRLYRVAEGQSGLFTTEQAETAGYSWRLVSHHVVAGRLRKVQRGIYRLMHFPAGPHEELVAAWLWAERAGTFSHETALGLHGVSGLTTAQVHVTVPSAWKGRRFRLPPGVVLHPADVAEEERVWIGAVPAKTALGALEDVAHAGMEPNELRRVANEAAKRGLVKRGELDVVRRALRLVGGLGRG
jgi:predicted transcriptional regulator of viral defense system